jgi:predicted metal-dependent hydrolase
MQFPNLPEYTLRRSSRARHVRLHITPAEGLVVVVPLRFDGARVPELLDAKRDWIERKLFALQRIDHDISPPDTIDLEALGNTWHVDYRSTASASVAARSTGSALILSGAVGDDAKCRAAIRRWLGRQAKHDLVPWLEKLSGAHDLPFRNVSVRGQKSRWGSCSSRQSISINYRLLFLAPQLVNCVLIHELCHTRHLNHGPDFWKQVEKIEPDYRQLHKRLGRAWGSLPGWVVAR